MFACLVCCGSAMRAQASEKHYELGLCGPIALKAVCSWYHITVDFDVMVAACGYDGRGVSVAGLVAAGEVAGLRAIPYNSTVRHLKTLKSPAIIDYPAGHFCVLFGWSEGKAVLFDGPFGRIEATCEQLERCWGKHAVVFSMEDVGSR
jgi:ABC-type bacteriocin/lantibiotic exporter with double-glycine peptidase domain